ncbi:MAG: hypothetical protein ACRC0L_08515 [Angustibacter sp.]
MRISWAAPAAIVVLCVASHLPASASDGAEGSRQFVFSETGEGVRVEGERRSRGDEPRRKTAPNPLTQTEKDYQKCVVPGYYCKHPLLFIRAPDPADPAVPAAIVRAVRDLPLARPTLATDPHGGETLVNLPTYFAVHYPTRGLQPGETTTLSILGHTIHIKPLALHHTYRFGDGTTTGPTPDPGGMWPHGNITHTYTRLNPQPATITTTYTAHYRTPGNQWQPTNLTIPITSTPHTIHVYEATNRLYDDPTTAPPP